MRTAFLTVLILTLMASWAGAVGEPFPIGSFSTFEISEYYFAVQGDQGEIVWIAPESPQAQGIWTIDNDPDERMLFYSEPGGPYTLQVIVGPNHVGNWCGYGTGITGKNIIGAKFKVKASYQSRELRLELWTHGLGVQPYMIQRFASQSTTYHEVYFQGGDTLEWRVICSPEPSDLPGAGWAKTQPDGTTVNVDHLEVTATFPGYVYAQDSRTKSLLNYGIMERNPNGRAGIRINTSYPYLYEGDIIYVHGTMGTGGLERIIDADTVMVMAPAWGRIAEALALTNKDLGGSAFGASQPGVTGGAGLNNVGLLVRTGGAFAYIDDHTFIVDDGSNTPIKCITPTDVTVDPGWQSIVVSGICSLEENGGSVSPVLLVRSWNDLNVLM